MTSGFRITHPLITLEITLEEVEKIHIHEEIIPDVLNKLAEKIKTDGCFTHPIIVDRNTLVVLDGMHRVAATRNIGFRFIPVCLVDYSNPNIVVGSWYRLIKGLSGLEEIVDISEELSLTIEDCSWETAQEFVEKREAVTAIFSRSNCFAIYGNCKGIKGIYDVIKQIESKAKSCGYLIDYTTKKDAKEMVHSGKVSAALMTPTVSKKEVVETVLAGKVFAQKTTRHVIPARPMFVNTPNKWLYRARVKLSEERKRLVKLLSSKKLNHLPSGQVLDRRYEEELYLFEDSVRIKSGFLTKQ